MKYLLKNVVITDPQSKWNGKKRDILIGSGRMKLFLNKLLRLKIAKCLKNERLFYISRIGWYRLLRRRTWNGRKLAVVSMAALAGRYTDWHVCPIRSLQFIHVLRFIFLSAHHNLWAFLHPIGAVSKTMLPGNGRNTSNAWSRGQSLFGQDNWST